MDLIGQFFAAIPFELIIIQTINGIVTGMILALIASGLTLIFGIMDVVNFAHGELFMLGAYVGVIIISTTGSFWLARLWRQNLQRLQCCAPRSIAPTSSPIRIGGIGRSPGYEVG